MTGDEISVVTPTLDRPAQVAELVDNLCRQTVPPKEHVLVDGAPAGNRETEEVFTRLRGDPPFACRYVRHGGGTAVQRNAGIDLAEGRFVALVDDDIRLEPDYFEQMLAAFSTDEEGSIGGIAGYITNQHLDPATSPRWKWYRRLRLFTTYEPGRYDYETGYPINRYLQPPHETLRRIDFMGAGCAVWRREVFDSGLRFAPFFTGYGVLEDAHFALRAHRRWVLLENGKARCRHLKSPLSRAGGREIARKSAVNYRYVFLDVVPQRTWRHELRFWRVQAFDLLRFLLFALRRPDRASFGSVAGKLEGMVQAVRLRVGV